MSDYIELNKIKSNQQKERVKNIISKSSIPIKKGYKGIKTYIAKKELQNKHKKAIIDNIRLDISRGNLKNIKDVEKKYGYGTFNYNSALQLIRQKELKQIREQAIFNARKKVVTAKAKEAVYGKPRVIPKGAGFNPMAAIVYGAPRRRVIKKRVIIKQQKHKPQKQQTQRKTIQRRQVPSQNNIRKKQLNDLIWNT